MDKIEPESDLQEVVHQRVRLGILAVLDRRGQTTFTELREALAQTDGSLSRHLGVLEQHAYVTTEKIFVNRRPRTLVELTPAGTRALRDEQEILSKMLSAADSDTLPSAEHDPTSAMTIAFAALLGRAVGEREEGNADGSDHAALVIPEPDAVRDAGGRPSIDGPISSRYDFPAGTDFQGDQESQRLMFISHGLRGGWVRGWLLDWPEDTPAENTETTDTIDTTRNTVTADKARLPVRLAVHCLVLDLATADSAENILSMMDTGLISIPDMPDARGNCVPLNQVLEGTEEVLVNTFAWFTHRNYLACVVVSGTEPPATYMLAHITTESHRHLTETTRSL